MSASASLTTSLECPWRQLCGHTSQRSSSGSWPLSTDLPSAAPRSAGPHGTDTAVWVPRSPNPEVRSTSSSPPPPSHPTGHRHGSNVPGATPQRVPGAAARQDATATLMVLGVVVVAFLWLTFLPFNVQHALAFLGVYGLRHPRPRPWAGMASEVRGPGSQGTSFFLNQYYFNTVHCLVGIKFEFQLQTQKSRILLLNIVFSHIHLIQPYF